jgi:hypothetical protein
MAEEEGARSGAGGQKSKHSEKKHHSWKLKWHKMLYTIFSHAYWPPEFPWQSYHPENICVCGPCYRMRKEQTMEKTGGLAAGHCNDTMFSDEEETNTKEDFERNSGHKMHNLGNSCFVISDVNALLASPTFTNALLDPRRIHQLKSTTKGIVFKTLKTIATSGPLAVSCIKTLRSAVAQHHISSSASRNGNRASNSDNFDDGRQHCPANFLVALLDCLNSEFRFPWVRNLFEFVIHEEQTCVHCDMNSLIKIQEIVLQVRSRKICTALHCTALHCTALHCTALHCTALHCTEIVLQVRSRKI